ncbi:MAG: TMEM198/TM7SF3 family protein [Deltaproteobacteria bacterium]|nr:MAG: TMEM198/TM7SF3 family protein [Deltaproteobacteria bacterium]
MEFSRETLDIIASASIIIGTVTCFFGYRIFKVVLGIMGFILGISIFGAVAYSISGGEQTVAIIVGLLGGIISAVLMVTLYFIGIFLLGVGFGSLLGILLTAGAGGGLELAVLFVLAILGGVATIIFQKLMITISTSFGGSWGIVSGIFHFIGWDFDPMQFFSNPIGMKYMGAQYYIMFLCWLVLGVLGIVVQYEDSGKKKVEEKK